MLAKSTLRIAAAVVTSTSLLAVLVTLSTDADAQPEDRPSIPLGYDSTFPVEFDADTGMYYYHGLMAAVDLVDDQGRPVLPTPEEMGICEVEPDACLGGLREVALAVPAACQAGDEMWIDWDAGLVEYCGLVAALDESDSERQPPVPSLAEMGVCDVWPDRCPEADGDETVPVQTVGWDLESPVFFDKETGLYHFHGFVAAVDFYDESGQPILPTPEEMGVCQLDPRLCE